jgi:hypothetical protein
MKMPTSAFKIENVPLRKTKVKRRSYPFPLMKVGQSFFIDPARGDDITTIRAAAAYYQNRDGTEFSIYREGNGYRAGRIK